VCDDYEPPFAYGPELREIEIEIPMLAPRDPEPGVTIAAALHRE
jgi:hypothetical protein